MFHTFYQFRETTQNNFVCIFAFFQFRKMIKTQQNSELYRTASRFAKLKKHTKLSTLVSIRFLPANYSKFVYMYFVYCTLYAMCLLWSRLNQWALPDSGKCAISPYRRLRRQPIPTGTSPFTPVTPVKGEDKY